MSETRTKKNSKFRGSQKAKVLPEKQQKRHPSFPIHVPSNREMRSLTKNLRNKKSKKNFENRNFKNEVHAKIARLKMSPIFVVSKKDLQTLSESN